MSRLLNSLPVVISVGMHLLLLAFVAWGWEAKPTEKKASTPRYVSAKIVQLKPTAPKAAPPKAQPKVVDLTQKRREQERQQKAAEERRRAEQAKKAKAEEARKEKERVAKEAAERQRKEQEQQKQREEQRRLEEQALADALAEEQAMLQSQEDAVVSQSYQDVIMAKIMNNWSRPPSARNGMRARLKIQLVPTGRVVSVTIVEGSGDAAFDRSAEQAVRKAEQFPELQKMPSRLFEQSFRELFIVFEPQDLRQ